MTLAEALTALDGKAELTADDAVALRRIIYGDTLAVTQDEAEALFKLNADAGSISPEWGALFVEAMTDFVVRQQSPVGYVDEAKADWLIASVSRYRRVRGDEIEMLIHVLDQAEQTPDRLSNFVLDLIKRLILSKAERGRGIARGDVERLRSVLFAGGGQGNIAVSHHDAEVLFDINDALKAAPGNLSTDPAWSDLFVRAVANSVMFASPWTPDAAREAQEEAWLADTSVHPLQRLEQVAKTDVVSELKEGFREVVHRDFINRPGETAAVNADEALEAAAAQVTPDEARWLAERIGRSGQVGANERALLDFIRADGGTLDPALEALTGQVDAPAIVPDRKLVDPPAPEQPAVEDEPGRTVFGLRRAAP